MNKNRDDLNKKESALIKTAYELAMEKLKDVPLPDDTLRDEDFRTEGRKLTAAFIRKESINLKTSIDKLAEEKKSCVIEGAMETFLYNIILPHTKKVKIDSHQSLEGITMLLGSPNKVLALCGQISEILDEYFKQYTAYYSTLKDEFAGRASILQEQAQSRLSAGIKIHPDQLPEFQKKWKMILAKMDEQYTVVLDDLKSKLKNVA